MKILEKEKKKIFVFFEKNSQKVFSFSWIDQVLNDNRKDWKLKDRDSTHKFIEFFVKEELFKEVILEFPSLKIKRYVKKDASVFEVAFSLYKNSYFSHYSAMFLHNLTDQVSKTVYLNFEQTEKPRRGNGLKQESIDLAFRNNQRISNNIALYEDFRICVLNGKKTNNLGVIEIRGFNGEVLKVTNIERTLIDIVVRPSYSGGVFEVLNAYKSAYDRVSINKLCATLKSLNYIYPYHQSIGFYLDKAGVYSKEQIDLVKKSFDIKFDFYLVHKMKDKEHSKEWRLFYPKGM